LIEALEFVLAFWIVFCVSLLDLEGLMEKVVLGRLQRLAAVVVVVDHFQYLPVVAVVVVPWPCLVLVQHPPFLRLFLIHLLAQ
jgi:hypothetical protein